MTKRHYENENQNLKRHSQKTVFLALCTNLAICKKISKIGKSDLVHIRLKSKEVNERSEARAKTTTTKTQLKLEVLSCGA